MFLTRDQILSAVDVRIEELEVPEWGGSVRVKGMTGAERDEFENSMMTKSRGRKGRVDYDMNLREARARVCALCVVDEDGSRLFTLGDIKALGQKSAAALDRVYEIASALSGIGPDDMEELVKNSDGTQLEGLFSS